MLNRENHYLSINHQWKRLDFTVADRLRPGLLWISCKDGEQCLRIFGDLRERYGERFQHLFCDLREWQEGELSAFLEEKLAEVPDKGEPDRLMVHLFGLAEKSLSQPEGAHFHTLNFEREILFGQLPFHLVIWSDADTQLKTQRQAPDFWDWVVNKFYFGATPATIPAIN